MKKEIYNVMIVDDLPDSTLFIQALLKNFPFVQLVCPVVCQAQEAFAILENDEHEVDILFLDMDMPGLPGDALMGMLSKPPITVVCTSHAHYGFKAAEIGAKAILSKTPSLRVLRQVLSDMVVLVDNEAEHERCIVEVITFKTLDKKVKTLQVSAIYYVSVLDKILTIHTLEEAFDIRMTLLVFLQKMPKNYFVQCHKSYAVPWDKIMIVSATQLTIGDREDSLPIGKGYGELLHKQFKINNLKQL